MWARSSILLALGASLLLACSVEDTTAPDGQDTPEVATTAAAASRTRGFAVPRLSPEEKATVLARYAHVDPAHAVPSNLLHDALFYFSVNLSRIPNKGHLAVIDFSRSSGTERFFMIDMESGQVTPRMVAHGEGSEDGYGNSTRFSNKDGSHQSSLGFVLTGETYTGVNGRSLRLDGLSTTNSNLRTRAVVLHSAAYVKEGACRQGTSFGCFALDLAVKDAIVDDLKDGALMYAGLGETSAPSLATPGASTHQVECPDPCLAGGCQR